MRRLPAQGAAVWSGCHGGLVAERRVRYDTLGATLRPAVRRSGRVVAAAAAGRAAIRCRRAERETPMAPRRRTRLTGDGSGDPADEQPPGQRRRPDDGQFRLQVDRQTKSSYTTYEAAEAAGLAI